MFLRKDRLILNVNGNRFIISDFSFTFNTSSHGLLNYQEFRDIEVNIPNLPEDLKKYIIKENNNATT